MNTATGNTPLAIVGIGCLFPKAAGPGAFWANVKNGVDGITEIPASHWNPDDYFDPDPKTPDMTYARRGGFLDAVPFRPMDFGIPPRDVEATDTSQLLGLVAARQALTDAGLGNASKRLERVSVILGVTGTLELVIPLGARLGHPKWKRAMKDAGVPDDAAADAAARIAASYVPWQENSFPGLLGNVVAGRIANKLDLGGTNCVVDAACASSLSAVHLAALELQAGRSDVVVTGGIDTFNDIFMYMCFSKTPALSPTGDAKPFDADGDGTILGEGLGVVVLKRLADAERDGDTIYAVLKGIGSSSDGKGNAIYAPSAEGQRRCLRTAYSIAGVDPGTVELVEAHGTGTKVGDTVEATALVEVFGGDTSKPRPWCAVGSVKSQIGHTKAAAGAASLVKAALALYHKVLPPTLKVKQPVEPFRAADSPFYVNTVARPWLPRAEHPRRAGLSAFGFGGSNFHAVLEEYRPAKAAPDWDGGVEVVALGAATPAELAAKVESLPTEWDDFARAAEASRAAFDTSADCRLAFAAHRTRTELSKVLGAVAAKLRGEPNAASWHTPDGVHYGRGAAPGAVAVLFPGQGSQQVGMLRDLACLFPEVLESLAAANDAVPATAGVRLTDRVYPPSRFDATAAKADDDSLRDTRSAQPAIGAVSWGAWRVLSERFGLKPAAFAGHSYGELVALAAAGRLSAADLFTLSRLRGELMAKGRDGDAGAMLAVFAPAADIDAVIRRESLNVVVANRNAPAQTVLSGGTAEIERAAGAFAAARVKCARLPVAAAFHSAFVADAAGPLREALNAVELAAGAAPVFANTTAAPYPADAAAAKDLLANQLANPVAFVDEVKALAAAGVRTFVEVGPGAVLTRLVEATLADAGVGDADVFAVDATGGKRPGVLDFGNTLARLAARGVAVRLTEWEAGSRCRPPAPDSKPGLIVPLTGANHINPRPALPPRPTPHVNGKPKPSPTPARGSAMTDPTALAQALSATQQSLAALQRMQEQAASLHRQFLESQEAAQRTLQALVEQQQALLMGSIGAGVALPPLPPPVVLPPLPPLVAYAPPAPVAAPVPRPAPVPNPVVPAAPKPTGNRDRIERTLLEVVAEKTGYPVGSLDLSQGLDTDLGVDSIKRVEILSALQEKLPDAPAVKPEHLGTLHTLKDVADFLGGGTAVAPVGDDDLTRTVPVGPEKLPLIVQAEPEKPADPAADVTRVLLEVVAEKTGYPVVSLDLTQSLDTDLGVDSIKRVEILSALQEKLPDAPAVKPEHLGTLHTLQDLANFLGGRKSFPVPEAPVTARMPIVPATDGGPSTFRTPVLAAPPTELSAPLTEQVTHIHPAAAPANGRTDSPRQSAGSTEKVDRSILQLVDLDTATPRSRVPVPAGAEVWVVGEPDALTDGVAERLAAAGFAARVMGWSGPGTNKPAAPLAGLVLLAPPTPWPDNTLNRRAFDWLHAVGGRLRQTGRQSGGAVFVTVARLDGAFGLNHLSPDTDPAAGGFAGLVKTARHEWPEVNCKAIDLDPAFDGPSAAAALAEEILAAGPLEVGVTATHRGTVELARTVRRAGGQPVGLGPKDVILVTGGGRGVTAEAAVALAETFGSTLILTGRTPPPSAEPDWLVGLTAEADIKKALAARLGPDAGPKQIGEQYGKVTAQREIRRTLARIETAGAKAEYFAVDAGDERAVADLLLKVRSKYRPVSAVVHGAGVLADRRIEDLTGDDFDRVYRTKVDGLRNLLDLLAHEDLKALVLFGSMTGRFGRTGQLAYACANEVLNKTAQVEARRRPGCRVVCVNWGPWEGGMVTPGLRRQFEAEGVGLIPLADGATFLVNELSAAGRAVEVLAMGKARAGGSGTVPVPAGFGTATPAPPGSGTHSAVPNPDLALAFERALDVDTHPVLRSHVLDGRAVLPMALHLEFLAHAALHGHPGLVFHGFNDLRITAGVKLDPGDSLAVRAYAGKAARQDKLFLVPVELRGKKKDGREVIKSRAEVILVSALPKPPAADRPPAVAPYPHPMADVYRDLLFHGPDLHGIERVDGVAELAITGAATTAPPPADWLTYPLRSQWVADPLVLDASFQLMILWSRHQHGAASLPNFAGRYRQFRRHFPDGPVTVVARVTRDNGTFARADIDYLDADGQVVAQLQDYECMMTDTLNAAFTRNKLGAVKA
ncbi:type I polyketide synthase [Urbifossiella limnaea]|uniref:Phenolphthiocerol synthesis polyketide synthase type I Pks15/1 n=1 Tax=Urbifossiella limnaea TaxID=2528023 RepID=A0A517XX97_9BACT|nr:type I polyketide synthase [Urbifossiella limnaea]QDU22137.1 Phenolphthiocerol synthesis polyketide synthase type I Pks15/1 [Urbifossiella limnaea]